MAEFDSPESDPIAELLIKEKVSSVSEAEEIFLDRNIRWIIELVDSNLTDEEFRSLPLIQLLLSRGSRPWEDSIT